MAAGHYRRNSDRQPDIQMEPTRCTVYAMMRPQRAAHLARYDFWSQVGRSSPWRCDEHRDVERVEGQELMRNGTSTADD